MHEADTQDAPKLLDAEALGKIQCVEIPVPGENSTLTEKGRNLRRMMIAQPERQRRAAFVKSSRISDAEDAHSRNGLQSRDQLRQQSGFVLVCRAVRGLQLFATAFRAGVAVPAQLRNVVHGCANSSN